MILVFSGCHPGLYTARTHFDCSRKNEFKADNDKKKLIYKILEEAVVTEKNIADYNLLADKHKIYICESYYSKFFAASKEEIEEFKFDPGEVPGKIGNVRFCLKSKEELQEIADSTSDFLFLNFGRISIIDDMATIGLATFWKKAAHSEGLYLSGGGYIFLYKKVNDEWVYQEIIKSWIS